MQTLSGWTAQANQFFEINYAITIKDIGLSDLKIEQIWMSGESPTDYAQRLSRKYGLIHRRHWAGGL
jgi:hypothetical protein